MWFYVEGIAHLVKSVVRKKSLAALCSSVFTTFCNQHHWHFSHHCRSCVEIRSNGRIISLVTLADTGCLVTVNGIDFMIPEPMPFSKAWWSHKFNGPGLRCEIAICIKTGWIVAYNGPFACGVWPDLKIFRFRLKQWLLRGEKVLADRGY